MALAAAFLSGTAIAKSHQTTAIEKVDDIRARLQAHAPEPKSNYGDPIQLQAQWFNFPNWPNWGNWNNWRNWGNWVNF
jgi:hypothetical protein